MFGSRRDLTKIQAGSCEVMTYQQDGGGFAPRQMFDVSAMGLSCATCGVAITELPFQPSGDRPVYCRDCNAKRRRNFTRGPRPRF